MTKLNIRGFKILTLNIILLFCLVLCSCARKKSPHDVIPPSNTYTVYYSYNTYEEMIAAGEKCDRKTYACFFDFQFEGVKEYSYSVKGLKSSKKESEDEEIDSTVYYCNEYIITGRFDDEKEFSLYLHGFTEKEIMEEDLKNILSYEWVEPLLYDEYEDYTRYFLSRSTYSDLANISFTGPFEKELIQQILDYVYN
ncbi:MAG: hypothetical protein K2I88_06800 [Anaeroplasmataceae bacterium]|nr:hypothetical protein [Anaeroplasmataceae bacterium]